MAEAAPPPAVSTLLRPRSELDPPLRRVAPGPLSADAVAQLMAKVLATVNCVVLGKKQQIRLCLACVLADGHILIEDVPGVGKTTLAQALAIALGLQYNRQQFTSDLLPSDVLGTSVFMRDEQRFVFQPGAVFTQFLLADEINRAPPKSQSALLEAMEERQVTSDGVTRPLPRPFFVIATQNPLDQIGTFPLPESQLDRFLMRVVLGYPEAEAEVSMLLGNNPRLRVPELQAALVAEDLLRAQAAVPLVRVSPALARYVYRVVNATREDNQFYDGLSPRAALSLLAAARAWALLDGRDAVLPDDVQAVFPCVAGHRLRRRIAGSAMAERDMHYANWIRQIKVES